VRLSVEERETENMELLFCNQFKRWDTTNRLTFRVDEIHKKEAFYGPDIYLRDMTHLVYPTYNKGVSSPGEEAMNKNSRLSRQQLAALNNRLSERDKSILKSISKYRYLTTNQIYQLHFSGSASQLAAHRATNRTLLKLKELELITSLTRRIGGVRAGSSSYIWALEPGGYRLLNISDTLDKTLTRKRMFEPSIRFLEHTLAISETSLQLILISNNHNNIELLKEELEPVCWRSYVGDSGAINYLKPDLYVVTLSGDYQDHWFFEIDLATESPSRIINKCQQYYRYFQSGTEQKNNGVFPLVVWIALDKKRAESLLCSINKTFGADKKDLFAVITPDELEILIYEGPSAFTNNSPSETVGNPPNMQAKARKSDLNID